MDEKQSLLEQLRIDRPPATLRSSGRGRLGWLVGGVIALALGGGGYLMAKPAGIPVRAVAAKAVSTDGPAGAESILDASGYVIPRRQATVSSNIIAKVKSILVEEGDRVQQGQIIAELEDAPYRAVLDQTNAAVKQAQAALAAATVAAADAEPVYQRDMKQVAQGLISQEAFDTAKASYDAQKTAVDVAQQNLQAARAAVTLAQSNEDYTTIRAPFTGVVTTKSADPGDIVSYNFSGGGGIVTIVDMDSLEVQVDVSENFINRVHAGQPATIRLNAYPDWQIPAAVIAIIPTADQTKATVKVRVAFKQKDARVLPQMGARVSFLDDAAAGRSAAAFAPSVVIAPEAVQVSGDTGVVFLIHGTTVEKRAVRLGAKNSDGQIVLSGVQPGAMLAVGDLDKLTDGAKVHVQQ